MTRRFIVPFDELDERSEDVVFLPSAGAGDWAAIFGHGEVVHFGAGDPLAYAGQLDRTLYFLAEGQVRVVSAGVPFKTVDAPSVLGEIAFLDGGPRSAGLVAATDGELVRFDMGAYDALAVSQPDLARRLAMDLGRIAALRLRLVTEIPHQK